MLSREHAKWQVGHERGADETDTIWRKFKCRDEKAGHALLEKLQDELYVQNEQGCRIRRETQGLFYMCCGSRGRGRVRARCFRFFKVITSCKAGQHKKIC